MKNNKYLYIQMSSIDDQITNRKVNINDDDKPVKTLTNRENSRPYIRKKVDTTKNSGNFKKLWETERKVNNEINLEENEIIFNHLNSEGNELKTKNSKNELKIFVPDYALEDRIINRQVFTENNIKA